MAIRRPPDDYPPRIVRRGDSSAPRVVRYEEPKRSFFRRVLRIFTRPYVAIPAVVIFALCATVLIYYWVVFSARIDNLLKGEVFTRSAGIYAAPKQIRAGQNISQDDVIAYLRRAGYVASPVARRARIPRRVGSASAANVRLSRAAATDYLTITLFNALSK